jgi:hypothetical protein
VEHHESTVVRLRNLLEILEDPVVPKGTMVRLVDQNEFSPIGMAVRERVEEGDDIGVMPAVGSRRKAVLGGGE